MAAALLQQLQQQNPSLLQNIVGQHHFANSTSPQINGNKQPFVDNAVKSTAVPPATIPAPPAPHNAINRRNTGEVS
jgi:hypothetical protein